MALFRMLLTAVAWQLASAALLAQEPVKPTSFVNTPDYKASDTLRVQLWVLGIVCTTGLVGSVWWMFKTTPGQTS
ncbi:Wdr64 [Symbiodinium necroappetens]|uniref:Wdr64 protein n=1 Tax=Symbiodinium necroappetens TaxID=1628268 RepID=A0A812LKR7_9DINO|nr:Wdr64 [Symbiodinium necroappetens]